MSAIIPNALALISTPIAIIAEYFIAFLYFSSLPPVVINRYQDIHTPSTAIIAVISSPFSIIFVITPVTQLSPSTSHPGRPGLFGIFIAACICDTPNIYRANVVSTIREYFIEERLSYRKGGPELLRL